MRASLAGVAAFAFVFGTSCIYLTGVQDYEKGACEGPCTDAATDGDTAADSASPCPSGMVLVAGGSYVPVSKPGGGLVRIEALCVDATEVTAAAYKVCVLSGTCTAVASKPLCNYGTDGRENDPINCVDVTQAKAYCASLAKRLPTDDEWEWVARGGPLGFAYPWGNAAPTAADDPEHLCWQGKTKRDDETVWSKRPAGTCAVSTFPRGARDGMSDLAGNVSEWTSTTDGTKFVYRGGSAFDLADPALFKVGDRRSAASASYPSIGVRCFASPR